MKILDKLNCRQLLEEYIKGNFKKDEFPKSLLVNHTYIYRYDARHVQVWGSLNKKSVTKYAVEKVFASFAIRNTQGYSVNNLFNFFQSKMIMKRNVPGNFFKSDLRKPFLEKGEFWPKKLSLDGERYNSIIA